MPAKQDGRVAKNSIFRIFYLYLYINDSWPMVQSDQDYPCNVSWMSKNKLFPLNDHHPILSMFHCILCIALLYDWNVFVIVSIFGCDQKPPNMQTSGGGGGSFEHADDEDACSIKSWRYCTSYFIQQQVLNLACLLARPNYKIDLLLETNVRNHHETIAGPLLCR